MYDVYIVGDGIVELAAALELAEVGLRVRVGRVDGQPMADIDAREPSGVRDPEGALSEFLHHTADPVAAGVHGFPAAEPERLAPQPVQLRGVDGAWHAQPWPSVCGIPAVPISTAAIALLGKRGAARAYVDRVRPPLTIGKTHALGDLVRGRMGRTVAEVLVEPVVRERYGVGPDVVDVALATPGLNEAMTSAGSLSGAVQDTHERDVARETRVQPRGGWGEWTRVMRQRLALYGVEFADVSVTQVHAMTAGWSIAEAEPRTPHAGELAAGEAGSAISETSAVVLGDAAAMRWPELLLDEAAAGSLPAESLASLDRLLRKPRALRDWARASVVAGWANAAPGTNAAVCEVDVAQRGRWSVRVTVDSSGGAIAQLRGPQYHADPATALTEQPIAPASQTDLIDEVLTAAGLERVADSEVHSGSEIARWCNVSERRADQQLREDIGAQHGFALAIGEMWHGGETAAAVADARLAAVRLRRRLTGITD